MMEQPGSPDEQRYRDGYFRSRDGLRLHYRDYSGASADRPLLCLPGLTRNVRDFAGFAEHYSPEFRVIALDYRGRGESDYDPLPARYNPLTYAGDVLQLLDELQLADAIFVGTSLGGLVTMAIAGFASERIAASILNDVGPELGQAGLDRIGSYVGKGGRFADWDEAARALAAINGNIPAEWTHDDWAKMARRACREEMGEVRFDYDMAIAQPFSTGGATPRVDLWPLFLALARKPLLVVRGEHSDLLTAESAKKMRQAAPQAKFVTVPRVGHAPQLTEPEAVAAIDEFLRSL